MKFITIVRSDHSIILSFRASPAGGVLVRGRFGVFLVGTGIFEAGTSLVLFRSIEGFRCQHVATKWKDGPATDGPASSKSLRGGATSTLASPITMSWLVA